MEELKPCPFCGGEAERDLDYSPYIKCKQCGVGVRFPGTPEMQEAWSQGLVIGITSECREYEAKAWNTRHEPTCENCHTEGTIRISGKYDAFQCSKCGWDGIIDDDFVAKTHPKFCPNCGAHVEQS